MLTLEDLKQFHYAVIPGYGEFSVYDVYAFPSKEEADGWGSRQREKNLYTESQCYAIGRGLWPLLAHLGDKVRSIVIDEEDGAVYPFREDGSDRDDAIALPDFLRTQQVSASVRHLPLLLRGNASHTAYAHLDTYSDAERKAYLCGVRRTLELLGLAGFWNGLSKLSVLRQE